jgi:hypothetical protein
MATKLQVPGYLHGRLGTYRYVQLFGNLQPEVPTGPHTGYLVCILYVCRLLHIGRIRMDIDNSRGYLGPRQNLQGIHVML